MHILTTPNPFLKHKAKPVASWDKKIDKEVREMAEILKKTTDPKGVGLAATQVGLDRRLFILLDDKSGHISIFVNPEIISVSKKTLTDVYKKKKDRWLEGCLSIPKIWGFVDRPHSVTLKYLTPKLAASHWQLTTITKDMSDMEAAYVQHEIDHLDGILFTDRIREQGGKLFRQTDDGLVPFNLHD